MYVFSRAIDLKAPLGDISLLLLGPRQTGKSTLIKELFPKANMLDLLDPELFRDLNKTPSLLREIVGGEKKKLTVIDEIQKLPELMDVVHSLIEEDKSRRFILTGSSARKLKKQRQNLLGGRLYPMYLHPITSREYLGSNKDLVVDKIIQLGGLPSVLNSDSPQRLLKAYVGIYLQEEIKAEGFARNLSDFSKFLEVAALVNSEQLDYSGVARDVQLAPRTVASYFSVLQDTLTGHLLESFKETKSRKAVLTPKFYYFDVGVCNFLCGREKLAPGTSEYGKAMEHFVFTELLAYKNYSEKNFEIFYWRSTSQFEVDFIIRLKSKRLIGIEVKGSSHIDKDDLKGLKAFEEDFKLEKKIIVSLEKHPRRIAEEIDVVPVKVFCQSLWSGKII